MNELHDLRDNLLEHLKLLVVEHEGYTAADRRAAEGQQPTDAQLKL
jgi:hypothetical protein